jgi:hypothetical protein
MPQPTLVALGAARPALPTCHTITLERASFQDAAACAALLPLLMTTSIATCSIYSYQLVPEAQLAAICCPDALAAVTRRITLRFSCRDTMRQMQAAVVAAGKAHVVRTR